jgi:hypothetical protein
MQLALMSGAAEGRLFGEDTLNRYLSDNRTTSIPGESGHAKILADWLTAISSSASKETSLEPKFIQDIICGVLGYTIYPPAPSAVATVWAKPPSSATGIAQEPDLGFGHFAFGGDSSFVAVGELKSPGTPFDTPQARKDPKTPVEQAFEYGQSILGVRWVLVTDMRVIRLYSVDSIGAFEKFDLADCIDSQGKVTEKFRRLYFLLDRDFLIGDGERSPVSSLYAKRSVRQLEIRDGFYEAYYQIRTDLHQATVKATSQFKPRPTREELLEATQRLLDRIVFIYYCEDHPQALIPHDTVLSVTSSARLLPGPGKSKVYNSLKLLFREVDAGSYPTNVIKIDGYNGELFKDHPIIDHIDLPDELHDRSYEARDPGGKTRVIRGVWGLHVYDFWLELDEHLLGHIFEQSLSDLKAMDAPSPVSIAERLRERRQAGIFYTTNLLSDFMAASAIHALLDDGPTADAQVDTELIPIFESRLERLNRLRIVDLACGSGAFLVSAYRETLQEYWRLHEALNALNALRGAPQQELFSFSQSVSQAAVLRDSLFGIDLLPQAVEIAKLALWLQSARKGEKISNLLQNIVPGDSLDIETSLAKLGASEQTFDLVIGNPPWGGAVSPSTYEKAVNFLGLSNDREWDTWELFLALGLRALKERGRLALLVPDSFFYPEKMPIRRLLFENAKIEKVYNLGPDWFGPTVRMGTVLLQACKFRPQESYDFRAMLLAGILRSKAIRGEVPLTQIEAQRTRDIPSSRCYAKNYEIEVFRGRNDDAIMECIERNSVPLSNLCERGRGEEINKGGLLWMCPSCLNPTTPGKKAKGGTYENKTCLTCGLELSAASVSTVRLIETVDTGSGSFAQFVDGDDIARRYQKIVTSKRIRLGVTGWKYKPDKLYAEPKIMIRQAGVGLSATYDITSARCPQSVYIYRLTQEAVTEGYKHEFLLAALLSRTMAYYIFKRYGEVDPAKAHAKLTHERLSGLPVPNVDFTSQNSKRIFDRIVENTRALLEGRAVIGQSEDLANEVDLRYLWGISATDGAYINSEFADLPQSQVVRDLFPNGVPKARIVAVAGT